MIPDIVICRQHETPPPPPPNITILEVVINLGFMVSLVPVVKIKPNITTIRSYLVACIDSLH
jgi:hypothetical protein